MRIMVCYDGSEAAKAMLPVARRLAMEAAAEVHLVRVSPHRFNVEGTAWSGSIAVDLEKHRQAEQEDQALRAELDELAQTFQPAARAELILGTKVADELTRYARGARVDLIALGCHDRGPLHGGAGGETTVRLARSKVAPVLLGPMVPLAHVDVRAVPPGCPVFSRDGYYVGHMTEVRGDAIRVVHDSEETWLPIALVADLSQASGLRLDMDMADVPAHRVEAPGVATVR